MTGIFAQYGIGYLNPSVTLSLMLTNGSHGRLGAHWGTPLFRGLFYMASQAGGALAGALLVVMLLPGATDAGVNAGAPHRNYGVTWFGCLLLECIGTFFLTWVIYMTTSRKRGLITRNPAAPLAIGITMTALQLFMYPFSGACFNPTRALASYIATWRIADDFLAYLIGPPAGALAAAAVYTFAFSSKSLKIGFDKRRPTD